MEKLEKFNSRMNSFGGISFIIAAMQRLGAPALFDSQLGKRPKQAKYSFSDIFLGWMYCNLCGAQRLEDVNIEGFYGSFKGIPIAKLCSPDQIGRIFRRFATPVEKHTNKQSGIEHEFNRNPLLNDLLLSFAKHLGVLNETTPYLLDYDGTTIPAEKHDCKPTFKGFLGYSPAVSMIGKIPVCIEARNGNTAASYKVKEALQELFERLNGQNIKTWGIRMDAASYQKEVIYLLDDMQKKFFIRASNTEEMLDDFRIAPWVKVYLHDRWEEIASVEFYPFNGERKFRFVITRFDKSHDPKTPDFMYRGIITNETEKIHGTGQYKMKDLEVIAIYDQRGDSENNFRDLLNDFNWKRVPFSDMNQNLVFLYVSAMAKCLYEYAVEEFSSYTPELYDSFKLKNFIAKVVRPVQVEWKNTPHGWSFDLLNNRDKFDKLRLWVMRK